MRNLTAVVTPHAARKVRQGTAAAQSGRYWCHFLRTLSAALLLTTAKLQRRKSAGADHRVHVEAAGLAGRKQYCLALHCAGQGPWRMASAKVLTRMRDELLNETRFFGFDHARGRITDWIDDYNDYTANLPATCDRLRNPDQLRRSHVALPHPRSTT